MLYGIIELVKRASSRILETQRHEVVDRGEAVALWCTRCHARWFRPALSELIAEGPSEEATLQRAIGQFNRHVDRYLKKVTLKAAV